MNKLVSKSLIRVHAQSFQRGIWISPLSSKIDSSSLHHPSNPSSSSSSQSIRHYSGTVSNHAPSSKNDHNDDDDDFVLLYQREKQRNQLPQAAFGFSVLNSTYWLWYTLDFIPAVNASPIDDLYINPMMGVGGVAFGLLINLVTGVYPYTLVSKLGYSPNNRTVHVWKHDLFPLIKESKQPKQYSLGTIRLNTSSNDTQSVLQDSASYSGHLGIQTNDERLPMLMEVRKQYELKDPQLLLQVLLDPNAMDEMSYQQRGGRPKKRQPKHKKIAVGAKSSSTEPISIKRRHGKKNKKR